jgi:hypothetical protein
MWNLRIILYVGPETLASLSHDAVKYSTMHGTTYPMKNYLVQNVNTAWLTSLRKSSEQSRMYFLWREASPKEKEDR